MSLPEKDKGKDQDAARNLALAFLRVTATRHRFSPIVRRRVETGAGWVFDFYHPRWHELRRRGEPYGMRIAVDKRTGKARHHEVLCQKDVV